MIDEEVRAAILAPIDGSVGIDGREDDGEAGELLRELRSQRRALVRGEQSAAMGDMPANEDGLSWEALAEQATAYLGRFGKDLEVAALLVEAAVREDGLPGLARTMDILADLVEAFWEAGLYPAEDEDGVEARFMPLSGLSGGGSDRDGVLIQPLRRMTLVRAGGASFSFLDKVQADAVLASAQSGTPEQKATKAEEAAKLYAQLDELTGRMSRAALEQAAQQVAEAETSWRRAIGFISERTKPRFPAASKLSAELQAMREWLRVLVARLPDEPASAEPAAATSEDGAASAAQADAGPASTGSGIASVGKISRREDALRAVLLAADYFENFEPLSPIGVTLREVDRRARMSLHDLMAELIPDESARDLFYWRSGIRPREAPVDE